MIKDSFIKLLAQARNKIILVFCDLSNPANKTAMLVR